MSALVTEIPQNVWLRFTDSSVKLKTDGVHRTSADSASDQLSQTEKGLCLFYTEGRSQTVLLTQMNAPRDELCFIFTDFELLQEA